MTGIILRCLCFVFLVPLMVFPEDIHQLCREGKSEQVLSLLKDLHMIHLKDRDGNTPLHMAVMFEHKELVRLLIHYGANVNENNNILLTPLHMTRNPGIVRELIDNGAEIDAVDYKKNTPLHLACRFGDMETVVLLIHHGANVNFQNKRGLTPLHFAVDRYFTLNWCSPAKLEIASYLIENGAEVNIKDNKNNTPLDYAAMYCNKDLAGLLMRNGAVKREIHEENGIMQLTFLEAPQLIRRVKPAYPRTHLRLSGIVLLRIVVNKQGLVKDARVTSGHPLLRCAAFNAVKKWVYEPKVIDGEARKVEFPVFIRFIRTDDLRK
jgi:TonB family protein